MREFVETLEKAKRNGSMIIYDLETTGISKKNDRIVQFSAIRVAVPSFEQMDQYNFYIKCPFPINGTEASAVNGITDELLAEKGISEFDALKKMKSIIHDNDVIGGFNNIYFDDEFMKSFYKSGLQEFRYQDSFDVFRLAKLLVRKEDVINEETMKPCYKLEFLCRQLLPDCSLRFHDSLDDVRATIIVMKDLVKKLEEANNAAVKKDFSEYNLPEKSDLTTDAQIISIKKFHPTSAVCRIYVNTNEGAVYYDVIKDIWNARERNLTEESLTALKEKIYKQLNVTCDKDIFARL